jgi:hypothetical protein
VVVVRRLKFDAKLRIGTLKVVDAGLLRPCILLQAFHLRPLRYRVVMQDLERGVARIPSGHAAVNVPSWCPWWG